MVQIKLNNSVQDEGVTKFFTTEGIIELDLKRRTELNQDKITKRNNIRNST